MLMEPKEVEARTRQDAQNDLLRVHEIWHCNLWLLS